MLLSRDEQAQLHELASHSGVPASVYLRTLIRNVHAEDFVIGGLGPTERKRRGDKDSLTELQDGRIARMEARRANGA